MLSIQKKLQHYGFSTEEAKKLVDAGLISPKLIRESKSEDLQVILGSEERTVEALARFGVGVKEK